MKYAKLAAQPIPQSEPLDSRQVLNNTGGYVYAVDDWTRLRRFLILGSDANTYYQTAPKLTRENAACVERCFAADVERTIREIVEVSTDALAPKNDPAIFAMAMGAANADLRVRQRALVAMPLVCRTATHLFGFVTAVEALGRGWGRSLKRAVAGWYNGKSLDDVAFQMVKYRAREGWSHGDMMKVAHPTAVLATYPDAQRSRLALYRWARGLEHNAGDLPAIVRAHLAAMQHKTASADLIGLIHDHRLPWEALPTEVAADAHVQAALLPYMGLTALIRQLGRLTASGVLKPLSGDAKMVADKLVDRDLLYKARIHPMQVLLAHAAYKTGHPLMGGSGRTSTMTWEPVREIVDALDEAFTLAFNNVEPTGKRKLIGVDLSHSMTNSFNGSMLSVRTAAAAMALVALRTERQVVTVGYSQHVAPLDLGRRSTLNEVEDAIARCQDPTSTYCALPILHALEKEIEVDVFECYTDNEANVGSIHPMAALREYRKKSGIAAKFVAVAMTSTQFSIADADDAGCMNVAGFDASAPAVIADFIRH